MLFEGLHDLVRMTQVRDPCTDLDEVRDARVRAASLRREVGELLYDVRDDGLD